MIESCHGSTEQTAPQALGVSVNLNRRLVASTFSYPTRDRTNSKLLVADRATVASGPKHEVALGRLRIA